MWKSKKPDTPQAADSKLTNLTKVTAAFGREHPPKMNNDSRPLDATANYARGWLAGAGPACERRHHRFRGSAD
jgi:hypothetical protein